MLRGLLAGRSLLRAAGHKNTGGIRSLSEGGSSGTSSSSGSIPARNAPSTAGSRPVAASGPPASGPAAHEAASTSAAAATSSSSSSTAGAGGSADGGGPGAASRLLKSMQAPIEAAQAEAAAAASARQHAEHASNGSLGRWLSMAGNALFFGTLASTAYFGYYTLRYSSPEMEALLEERKKPENAFPGSQAWVPLMSWYLEQRRALEEQVRKYSDPPSEHLLPDLPLHARHVRTLVLDLDDTLIHSDWTRGRGWKTFKRPGAEDFIRNMAQFYELVVYTDQLPTYADPILDRLDPQRFIQYRLYRDSTQYVNGKHVRNLQYLNRDLSKVLLITASADAYHLQPDNAIKLKPWKLEAGDTALLDLLPLLEQIFRTNVPDVRAVVRSFEGQDIPSAFRERMLRLQQQQKQQERRAGLFGSLRR